MWLIGVLVGAILGAGMHGGYGAMWGAIVGWLVALLVGRNANSSQQAAKEDKFDQLEKRIAHTQKAVEDIHWRLNKLEETTGLAAPHTAPAPTLTAATDQPLTARNPMAEGVPPIAVAGPEPANAVAAATVAATAAAPAVTLAATPPPIPTIGVDSVSPPAADPPPIEARVARAEIKPPVDIQPGLIQRLLEGNIVAKIGVVILFFGVGFALKFAYDRGVFPPEMRLFGVAVASAVMCLLGARLLKSKRTYALILFGGAMGLLYLDVFFALKTFELISAPAGFVLFAVLGIATLVLAVKLDARAFAALGLFGAFIAPILASTGSGHHELLFSYYLLLNLVILGASWFKAWRELNFIGFLFTFAIALIWGYASYNPENFATVEPFLIAFFLLYLAIPILFAQRQPPELKGIVDGTLVFGMPLSAAMLQAAVTRGMGDYVLAWSALAAALIYAMLAWLLWRREKMRLLAEAHLALALVFATVAPYFAFRGYPTFAFWTLEGAAIFWMGCRQKSVLARAFALCLQLGATAYFWWVTYGLYYADPWWNDRVLGCWLIAAAALLTAWFMHRFEEFISPLEFSLQGWWVGWGSLWLFVGCALGIWQQWTVDNTRLSALLIAGAVIVAVFEWTGTWLAWRQVRRVARAHLLLIAAVAVAWAALGASTHPLAGGGVFAWPITFIVCFFILHRQRDDDSTSITGWRYVTAWCLMLALATWEAAWRYDRDEFGWVFAIGAVGLLAAGLRFRLHEFGASAGSTRPTSLSIIALAWALVWWFAGLHGAIETRALPAHHFAMHLAVVAVSALFFEAVGRKLQWLALRRTQVLLTLAMLIGAAYLWDRHTNPFRGAQAVGWLLAYVVAAAVLFRQERDAKAWLPQWQHIALFNLAIILGAWEVSWRADYSGLAVAWQYAGVGLVIALGLFLASAGIEKNRWPFGAHAVPFRNWSVVPLLGAGLLWALVTNVSSDGSIAPLTYLPIINPLDIAQLALFAACIWAVRGVFGSLADELIVSRGVLVFAGVGFLWVNAALLRSVHHWADIPFELAALLDSVVAQAALSLLWSTTALVMMYAAGKLRGPSRALWITGAALLGLVLLKLFFNDLGNTGTVARIVSFIGVGVLLMVIGYVAPVPPKAQPASSAP